MKVSIRGLQAGGRPQQTQWLDLFGDTPGRTLALAKRDYLFAATSVTVDMTPSFGGSNGLRWVAGNGSPNRNVVYWNPVALGGIRGREQFSECIILEASVNARGGPAVYCVGDGRDTVTGLTQGYALTTVAAASMTLQSIVNNAFVILGAFGWPGLGARVTLAVSSNGTSDDLEVFYDGVSQGVVNVAVPTVARAGLPGLHGYSVAVGPAVQLGTLRCGALGNLGY